MPSETRPGAYPSRPDSYGRIVRDFVGLECIATALIFTKVIRGVAPEPFDIGYHTGNAGMTMSALAIPLTYMRTWRMKPGRNFEEQTASEGYSRLRKQMFAVAAIASLGLNLAAEYKDDIYSRDAIQKLTGNPQGQLTTDPIDIAYGMAGGMAAGHLMSRRFIPEPIASQDREKQPSHRSKKNHGKDKDTQKASRKRNRKNRK